MATESLSHAAVGSRSDVTTRTPNELPPSMTAAWLTRNESIELRVDPLPAIGPHDLLVRVRASGVCGSDLSTYRGIHPYKRAPVILGHEMAGEVVAIGTAVTDFSIGQTVTTVSFSGCGSCAACQRGSEQLCRAKHAISHDGWQGSFAEYMRLSDRAAVVLPDGTDFERAALIEPLSIGLHALKLARDVEGRRLAIIGAGNVGLATLVCARRMGVGRTLCIDTASATKKRLALACGADEFLAVHEAYVPGRIEAALGSLSDITVVASGHATAVAEACAITRSGGEVVIVSYFEREVPIDLNALVRGEQALLFSALSNLSDFRQILSWLAERSIDPLPMVTHRFVLQQADEAMRLMHRQRADVGKVLLSS